MAALKTVEMIAGKDSFCMNFLQSVKAGEITAEDILTIKKLVTTLFDFKQKKDYILVHVE